MSKEITIVVPVSPRVSTEVSRSSGLSSGPVGATTFGALASLPARSIVLASDGFLGHWQQRNHDATIRHCIENLETSGVLHNFRRITDTETGEFLGMWFADSDLYKTLEAIGWESQRVGQLVEPEFVDLVLTLIERAQEPDGYLNTYVQGDATKTRWSNLVWSHELYCAGHMFQAAVALGRGAGNDRLLEVAKRFADRILEDLGDRVDGYDGHAEIETALVELYRLTNDQRYLDFAEVQIKRRGHGNLAPDRFGRAYFGDHEPIEQVEEVIGHAVRQIYYATGATDVYLETGQLDLLSAVERLWDSAFSTKTYITGGQGSRHTDESFGDPYELPPDRAYAETCAAIASFQWNWRMLLATGDARHAEEMETALYNTIAASVALDGKHFFYTNPLQLRTGHRGDREDAPNERLSWFECACCPPNLARLVASLQDYLATTTAGGIQIHHLAPFAADVAVDGALVRVGVATGFPWRGGAAVTIEGGGTFDVAVRVPMWVDAVTVRVDGEVRATEVPTDRYVRLRENWTDGRTIELDFAVTATIVEPHPRIDAARGSVALRRGPFVYCLEGVDHDGAVLEDLRVDPASSFTEVASDAPGVEVALTAPVWQVEVPTALYHEGAARQYAKLARTLTAIPYFAWGNRGQSAMRVWIPTV